MTERGADRGSVRRPSTQADVARLAGVSIATVSYVVSGRSNRKSSATAEVIERVQDAVQRLDYVPSRAGRVLARRRTDLIATSTISPATPWTVDFLNQIESVAAENGLGLVVFRHGHTPGATQRVEALLADGLADAAIIVADSFEPERIARIARRVPVLAVGRDLSPVGFNVLHWNEARAVRSAVDYLIENGVRKPAFIGGSRDDRRRSEFVRAFEGRGFRSPQIIDLEDDPLSLFFDARSAAVAALDRPSHERPDAIMAYSDRAAISTLWAAVQLRISVPEELKIIGTGNIPDGAKLSPALTTIGADMGGYRAPLEHLISLIGAADMPHKAFESPWRLIVRETA